MQFLTVQSARFILVFSREHPAFSEHFAKFLRENTSAWMFYMTEPGSVSIFRAFP
jgi:hypothetical protein